MRKFSKELLKELGFLPKNGTIGVYYKKYKQHNDYCINIDFTSETIDYGNLITFDCKTTQNFSQTENGVVLECVNRLLEKGYKPQNITLEKVYPSGHGHSGRLDILITKDSKAFLMIECKTWGKEFNNELNNIQKNGGQLLTYFQNDKDAEYLMLYTSRLSSDKIEYQNEVIKIEDYYRQAGNVADTYERWNKQTYSNGIFEDWVNPYCYKNKPLTKADLLELTEENSGKIFHGFLSILRKHSVSDKPNAFNKIFNLFLAKIYDEKKRENDMLEFQWLEDVDNPVDFQVRLYNLHKSGLYEFLKKEIEGISDEDFKYENEEELLEKKKKFLKFNKVFDIKDVIDDESFDDNFKVLKEVVQLLEKYQIRYPRKQQHLSDFFERLLSTGLKQEAGQFFTPPPITKFITKSLPLDKMLKESINQPVPKLPAVIDYAAGSGHFITEIMEAYQDCIDDIDTTNFYPEATKTVSKWKLDPYSWAGKYVYGIEKDYRLVKVAKVGCYFYGDGLAQVIHGDGLDSFNYSKNYVGLLSENTKIENSKKAKFSIVVSNPPYSVDAFKGNIKNSNVSEEFELYKYLTDRSSEIECLFVERTKQLLKDDGVAGIVLPSSILTNAGIYTRTREILLKYFEIIAITELGSNTFMATGTNTVVLFLRRRNNKECITLKKTVDKFFTNHIDVTINCLETPVSKYVNYVWEGLTFDDYVTLLEQNPNDKVKKHNLYKEYSQKIISKTEKEFWNKVIALEKEKIYYFILAYPQKLVIVKTGEKEAEKQFLGYYKSDRRGSEGMHAFSKGKSIDECTKLYDNKVFDNPQKASTYIYKAFENDFDFEIDETLKANITRINLLDMMIFDRADFEKSINVKAKKKIKLESKWKIIELGNIPNLIIEKGKSITKQQTKEGTVPVVAGGIDYAYMHNVANRDADVITISASGANAGYVNFWDRQIWASDCSTIKSNDDNTINIRYVYEVLCSMQNVVFDLQKGNAQPHVYIDDIKKIQFPIPPIDIQKRIVKDIDKIENNRLETELKLTQLNRRISGIIDEIETPNIMTIQDVCSIKITDGTHQTPTYCNKKEGVPFISSKDVTTKKINWDENSIKYIIPELHEKLYKRIAPQRDDVLLAKNGTIGVAALVETDRIFDIYVTLAVLRPNKQLILPKYLLYIVNSDLCNKQFNESIQKGMGVPNLHLNKIQTVKIPVPNLREQKEIITQIDELEKQITEAQAIINNSKQQKQEILDKYLL